jgi:hypothetical protein
LAECHIDTKIVYVKPLKIRPHATKAIDTVLRRTAGAGGPALYLSGHDAFLKVISISSSAGGQISGV